MTNRADDIKKWAQAILRALQQGPSVDGLAFLADVSILLYSLEASGTEQKARLSAQDWRDTIAEICRQHEALRPFCHPIPTIDGRCVAVVEDVLDQLQAERSTFRRDAAMLFNEILQQMVEETYIANFITPQALSDMMAAMMAPQPGEQVLDPVCGSGRLLVAAHAQCSELTLCGVDIDARLQAIAFFNLHLNGRAVARLRHADFLRDTQGMYNRFDIVLANPPYESDIQDTMDFIDRILDVLKPNARCAILVPTGFLNNDANAKLREFRERILRARFLAGVVSLPLKMYKPYTESHSSLLLLKKGCAHSGEHIFFSCLREYAHGESNFADQTDMIEIVNAWKAHELGAKCPERADPVYWTATPQQIQEADCFFSADTYRPTNYVFAQAEHQWDNIIQGQARMNALWARYTGENDHGRL